MSRPKALLLLLLVCIAAVGPTCPGGSSGGPLPAEAHTSGVTNAGWPVGIPLVAALGELIRQRHPDIDATDIIVRSGLGTQARWSDASGGYLSPHPRMYSNAPAVDAAVLLGVGYRVGFVSGGAGGLGFANNADKVRFLDDGGRAQRYLKTAIAGNRPTLVHVDFFYLQPQVSAQEPYWAAAGREHRSHFVVVHGYDPDYVYFADNGPRSELGESCDTVRVTWRAFMAAWRAAARLPRVARMGPCFACILSDENQPAAAASPSWTLSYLGLDAASAPAAIRAAAAAIGSGADPSAAFRNARLFADARAAMAAWAASKGFPDIAARYEASAILWRTMLSDSDPAAITLKLGSIADAEEEGLAAMRDLAASEAPIVQLAPPDNTSLSYTFPLEVFRWAALPGVARVRLELAMGADFGDSDRAVSFAPRFGASAVMTGDGRCLKIVSKDDGDRSLSWRVAGRSSGEAVRSDARRMRWDPLKFVITSPESGYILGKYTHVDLTWSGPAFAPQPQAVFSADSGFSPQSVLVRVPGRHLTPRFQMHAHSPNGLYDMCRVRHLTTVYWRVEDAEDAVSTVAPSESKTMSVEQPLSPRMQEASRADR